MRYQLLLLAIVIVFVGGCASHQSIPVYFSIPPDASNPEIHVDSDRGTRLVLKSTRPNEECLLYVDGILAYNRLEYRTSGGIRRKEGLSVRFSDIQPSFYHHWQYLLDGAYPYYEPGRVFNVHAVCYKREEFLSFLKAYGTSPEVKTPSPACVTPSARYTFTRQYGVAEYIVGRGYANCINERR
jgi:hypothetical protein